MPAPPNKGGNYSVNVSGISIPIGKDTEQMFECWNCHKTNYIGMEYCASCGESLSNVGGVPGEVMTNYFSQESGGPNMMY